MISPDEPPHEWPEEEPTTVRTAPRPGRLARIARAVGDTAITIGMSRGMTGRGTRDSSDALVTNSLLFSEGTNKGHDANGRDGD
jgi:hypothetical protein